MLLGGTPYPFCVLVPCRRGLTRSVGFAIETCHQAVWGRRARGARRQARLSRTAAIEARSHPALVARICLATSARAVGLAQWPHWGLPGTYHLEIGHPENRGPQLRMFCIRIVRPLPSGCVRAFSSVPDPQFQTSPTNDNESGITSQNPAHPTAKPAKPGDPIWTAHGAPLTGICGNAIPPEGRWPLPSKKRLRH